MAKFFKFLQKQLCKFYQIKILLMSSRSSITFLLVSPSIHALIAPDGPSRPATTSSIFSFHCVLFTVRWTAAGSVHPHQSMMSSIHRLLGGSSHPVFPLMFRIKICPDSRLYHSVCSPSHSLISFLIETWTHLSTILSLSALSNHGTAHRLHLAFCISHFYPWAVWRGRAQVWRVLLVIIPVCLLYLAFFLFHILHLGHCILSGEDSRYICCLLCLA